MPSACAQLLLLATAAGAAVEVNEKAQIAELKGQIAEKNAVIAEKDAVISSLRTAAAAAPARKVMFAPGSMPTQEEVDAFVEAYEELKGDGVKLVQDNVALLKKILPPMWEFAAMSEAEKAEVLGMLSLEGRRHLEGRRDMTAMSIAMRVNN